MILSSSKSSNASLNEIYQQSSDLMRPLRLSKNKTELNTYEKFKSELEIGLPVYKGKYCSVCSRPITETEISKTI